MAVEGEIKGRIDTFCEHQLSAFLPSRGRQKDRDVAKRPLRLTAYAVVPAAASAVAADGRVVALVGPGLASNRDRVPDTQPRRTIQQDARWPAGGAGRRETEGGNEHGAQD
jgi:hypothetical protein